MRGQNGALEDFIGPAICPKARLRQRKRGFVGDSLSAWQLSLSSLQQSNHGCWVTGLELDRVEPALNSISLTLLIP